MNRKRGIVRVPDTFGMPLCLGCKSVTSRLQVGCKSVTSRLQVVCKSVASHSYRTQTYTKFDPMARQPWLHLYERHPRGPSWSPREFISVSLSHEEWDGVVILVKDDPRPNGQNNFDLGKFEAKGGQGRRQRSKVASTPPQRFCPPR